MRNIAYYLFLLFSLTSYAQEEFSVYFESNRFDLKKAEHDRLQNFIKSNREVKVVAIDGYTDEDGSSGFNDTLAKKRVDFIYSMVKPKLKIRDDFKTRSFGERHKHSKIKAANRKVAIYYIQAKDLAREDEILGIKKEAAAVNARKIPKYRNEISVQNPDGKSEVLKLDIQFMEKLAMAKAGEKLVLENLNFQLNTFAVTKESRPKMHELLEVMLQNPKMKIQVRGHICCMANDRQDLSGKRAKAIARFLELNGIAGDRISFKGLGVSEPLFAIPEKTEQERAANRRVEIEIVEN
ncbi:MAG TPA: OmpA family protein [Flavobacterium sp.]|nr:OmpA family protein [Flavobacterium sp.]